MIHALILLAFAAPAALEHPAAADILARMIQADTERAAALKGYSGMRRYTFREQACR